MSRLKGEKKALLVRDGSTESVDDYEIKTYSDNIVLTSTTQREEGEGGKPKPNSEIDGNTGEGRNYTSLNDFLAKAEAAYDLGTDSNGENGVDLPKAIRLNGENASSAPDYSVAIGEGSKATKNNSFAIGSNASARAPQAAAFGEGTAASGNNSFAIGYGTVASSKNSVAIGEGTTAKDCNNAFAAGYQTTANGKNSVAFGNNTIADGENKVAVGNFNSPDKDNIFEVGCGTSEEDRKNALNIDKNGTLRTRNLVIRGNGFQFGGSYMSREILLEEYLPYVNYQYALHGSPSLSVDLPSDPFILYMTVIRKPYLIESEGLTTYNWTIIENYIIERGYTIDDQFKRADERYRLIPLSKSHSDSFHLASINNENGTINFDQSAYVIFKPNEIPLNYESYD